MKVIFISGPYRAKTEWELEEHILEAEQAAVRLWKLGWAVICPHKNAAHFGGICSDSQILESDLEILKRCDAIYLLKSWMQSSGASKERELAKALGLKIYEAEFDHFPRP